jgi:hypothetical protein
MPMPRVVALMDDLFFQMKVAETAKQLGLELKVAANASARRKTAFAYLASSLTCKRILRRARAKLGVTK